jgi:hypothetical protein
MKSIPESASQLPFPVPVEAIERRIYLIRGQKVMTDSDLAELYQSQTSRLNEAVKRNRDRFPEDFMFQLTPTEAGSLLSQNAIAKAGRGGRRNLPYAFTEHGVAMLSSVLNSTRAIQLNILIVRAFVRLREILASHKDVAQKIEELDREQRAQGAKLERLYDYVTRHLVEEPAKPKRRIGFAASAGQK